jgi:Tfp pilus assembly protein PilF
MGKLLGLVVTGWLLLGSTAVFAASEEAVERNSVGTKLLQQGKIEAAIAEFQKALVIDPNYIAAQLNLAYGYERANRVEEAMDAYRKASDLDPGSFFAHNNLGVLYDKKGAYEQAIVEFQNALKSEPSYVMAQKNLEIAKKNKAIAQERETRIAQAEKQVQGSPKDPKAAYQLARLYAIYGMKDLALQWLAKAVSQGYNDFTALKADPGFSNLRDDREFGLLLQRK